MSKGEYDRAADYFRCIVSVLPDCALPYANLAWIWSTHPEGECRDGKKALGYAAKACKLTGSKDAWCRECLAAAYAETGQYAEAVRVQRGVLESPQLPPAARGESRRRLQLYEKGQPFRGVAAVRPRQ
jgi:hypothetical protein